MAGRDPGHLTESLALLPEQLAAGWRAGGTTKLPAALRRTDAVLVAGMGGSHLGPRIAASVFAGTLKKPILVHAGYGLPSWVNRRTLVVCSSYSGGTEETLSAFHAAVRQRVPVVALSGGGALAAAAQRAQRPAVTFPTATNPCNQPRFGVGLSLGAFTRTLVRTGALPASAASEAALVHGARTALKRSAGWTTPASRMLAGRIPLFIGAEHLLGTLHTAANQFNENAKTIALHYALPDLNHHLLEGLSQPRAVVRNLVAVGFDSPHYAERNRKRLHLTLGIFRKRGARTLSVRAVGPTRMEEALFVLAWSGAVSVALARATKQKPQEIPWVEYFKRRLGRSI